MSEPVLVGNTRVADLYMLGDHIFLVRQKDNLVIELNDLFDLLDEYSRILAGKRVFNILVLGEHTEYDSSSFQFNAPMVQKEFFIAQAMVFRSLPHRIMARGYRFMHKPEYPIEVFGNESEAIEWVSQLIKDLRL